MKRILALLMFLAFAGSFQMAKAQFLGNGNITAAGTGCTTGSGSSTSCVVVAVPQDAATISFTVSGTFSATLQFKVSQDGVNFASVNAFPPNSTTPATNTTAAGTWSVSVSGMAAFEVYASAYTSGTATVSLSASRGAAASLSTGGGGTGCIPGGAAGVIQASNGLGACQTTALTDNGTSIATGEPLTGGWDFSGASALKLRVAAGLTTAANGDFGFDSTNNNWHGWNGADVILAPLAAGFVSGHCGQPTTTAGKWVFADSGAACGSGGSGTVTDGTGTTTAGQLAESTTTAHVLQYATGITSAQCPAATSSAIGCTLATSVVNETANTTSSGSDSGTLYDMNGASLTFTLPASVPANGWMISVQNLNSSALTIALNTHTYNGGSSNLTLQQYQSVTMKSDGSAITGTVPLVAGTNVTLTQAANGQTVAASSGTGTGFNNGAGTGYQDAAEIAAPANPASGNDRLYLDSTAHQLKCLTSAGASCMPSGSGGYATIQNNGTALTQRTTANVADGIEAVDDSTNSATIIRQLQPSDGWWLAEHFTHDATTTVGGTAIGEAADYLIHNINGTGTLGNGGSSTTPGGWSVTSGATSGNDSSFTTNTNPIPPSSTTPIILHFFVLPGSVTANGYFAAGVTSSRTAAFVSAAASAAWCDVTNTTSAGNWACHTTGQSGSTTNVTLSPAQTATVGSNTDIEIVLTTTAATFYFNGTQVGQSTTNLPSVAMAVGAEAKTAAANTNAISLLEWTATQK